MKTTFTSHRKAKDERVNHDESEGRDRTENFSDCFCQGKCIFGRETITR